jgi:hypothetical protein
VGHMRAIPIGDDMKPSFSRLFPGSALFVSVDDETSCDIVCKCALLIGLWQRMERPVTFLRRPPMYRDAGLTRAPRSDVGGLVIDRSETQRWIQQICADLADGAAASVTLAGSGLHDVILDAALTAALARIPVIVVADAVQGRSSPFGQSEEGTLSFLEQFAWLMPMATLMPIVEA